MSNKIKKLMYLLPAWLLVLFLYIFLHEFGHLTVMLYAGATITDFSIITAHVSSVGGNYSDLSDLWLHANGALLPVIAAFIYMFFYKQGKKNPFYIVFSFIASLAPFMSIITWVMIPFLYTKGKAPLGDDVTKFLINFTQSHHVLTVSFVALSVMGSGIALLIKKGIIKNFILLMKER